MERNHTRDYYRKVRAKAITRKKRLDHKIYWADSTSGAWYKHDGCYSKGKIHCSCDMCNAKTRFSGYKFSDLVKHERDKAKVEEMSDTYNLRVSNRFTWSHRRFRK